MDEHIASVCPARFNCKQHNILCGTGCPLFMDLRYQMELSGLPKRFNKYTAETLPKDMQNRDLLNKWAATSIDRVKNGQGLFFFGSVGTGKTTAAGALAMSYVIEQSKEWLRYGKRSKQLLAYANVPDLLELIKRGFDDPDVAAQAAKKLEMLRTAPLVILDDIGAERPSEWQRERLLTICGSRYDEELSTIITSNLTIGELVEPLGSRLQSRIAGMTVPVEFRGADRRKQI